MSASFDQIIVCGNSDAFGSEIGESFQTIEDSIKKAQEMKTPHPMSWPLQMNQVGSPVLNSSLPGSGMMSNVARALKWYHKNPQALFVIDITLIDHLPREDRDFFPKNAVLFDEGSIELEIYKFSPEAQIFLINEQRKLLHQVGMKFKFIMMGNPVLDFTNFVFDRRRASYPFFLRSALLRPLDLPKEILKDCLLPKPYFHYFPQEKVSSFCHITDLSAVTKVAELMSQGIRESYA